MGRIVYRLLDGGRGILHDTEGFFPGAFFAQTWQDFADRHRDRVSAIDYWVSDYARTDASGVRSEDVQRIVDITAGLFSREQVIGTHAPSDVDFGMTRMWHLRSPYSDPDWRVAVYRDRDALLEWIGEQLGGPVAAEPGEMLLEARYDENPAG